MILAVFLSVFVLQRAVEWGLLLLAARHVARCGAEVPPPLAARIDAETARRSRDYALARSRLALASGVADAALVLAVLLSGVLPWLDARLLGFGLDGPHRFVVFLATLGAASAVAGLPFSLYGTFVLEARFGFNRTAPRLWLLDRLKGIVLAAALGIPLLYGAWFLAARTGGAWWLWLFGFLGAVQLALAWLWPSLIAPWFNRFAPLPEGELRARLEGLARAAGFRTRGLFVMDASRRSRHSNAWFAGVLRPRIVLFDTLVERTPVDEALAVLAHEIGHFRMRHVLRGLALGLAGQLLGLWVLSRLVRWPPLFPAFGFAGSSLHAALALVALGGGSFTFFLSPLGAWLSRRRETQADAYAVRLTGAPRALQAALVRLGEVNLATLHSHPWYAAWHYRHPPLLERLAAIDRMPVPDAGPGR